MKTSRPIHALRRGVSLVETMVAIGVLAIVAPLALAAMLKSGEGGSAARAETRAPAIVESCLRELGFARDGGSDHLAPLQAGQPFGADTPLCLAFGRDGSLLGAVEPAAYDRGIARVGNRDAYFLARLQGTTESTRTGFPAMLEVTIAVEHPAVAPALKRRKLDFHTKLP
jgi:type II secretory pathway pseudopilin PulG